MAAPEFGRVQRQSKRKPSMKAHGLDWDAWVAKRDAAKAKHAAAHPSHAASWSDHVAKLQQRQAARKQHTP